MDNRRRRIETPRYIISVSQRFVSKNVSNHFLAFKTLYSPRAILFISTTFAISSKPNVCKNMGKDSTIYKDNSEPAKEANTSLIIRQKNIEYEV